MALPAGRYGVTKNQLLKIKKLPMNTIKLIEELTEKFDLLGTAAFKNSTSVVTESSDLVESGAVYTALQSKADNSVIGTVEGANASKAWSVGEHFISGGQFKEVTQAIASGGAINDSNTVNKPIAEMFKPIDITSEFTFSADCTWSENWTQIIKIGNTIKGKLRFKTPSALSSDFIVISVPNKYKPSSQISMLLSPLVATWDGAIKGIMTMSGYNHEIYLASNGWQINTEVLASFEYDLI